MGKEWESYPEPWGQEYTPIYRFCCERITHLAQPCGLSWYMPNAAKARLSFSPSPCSVALEFGAALLCKPAVVILLLGIADVAEVTCL